MAETTEWIMNTIALTMMILGFGVVANEAWREFRRNYGK